MSTQVATSHTVQTRAPLKVPKRPPMNHVAKAIQKFLPIVVGFLLTMVIYSYIRPSTTVYPPYSPPNVGEDTPDRYGELGDFARNTINKRAEMFEEMKRKSEGEARTGEWQVWRGKQTSELKQKLEDAKAQGAKIMDKAGDMVNDLQKKSGTAIKDTANAFKSMGEEAKDHTIDAADWWKDYGEKLVDDANDFSAAAQEFAYDAIYAWKQKAAAMKETAKDKLEDLKDAGEDVLESGKQKAENVIDELKEKGEALGDVKEAASDLLSSASEKVHKTLEKSIQELSNRLEGIKEGLLRVSFDDKTETPSSHQLIPQRMDNDTMSSKISSLIERVKAGLVHDEEVRRAMSMKAEWDKLDFDHKVSGIVQQICLLGDDVVEEVIKRLEDEHTQGNCLNQAVCPKL